MILSYDEAYEILDEEAKDMPEAFYTELNGGLIMLEEECIDPVIRDLYILGEYCDDLLGNYINLYYGSFSALAERENWDEEIWKEELWITLSHEFTHHMEKRGGLHGLDDRDAEELEAWKQDYRALEHG